MANKVPIAGCQSEPPLLLLPDLADPCLVAVLACCADDLPSLFSAARAHSRLRHAAALALRSITVVVTSQEQADSLLLTNHGQHVHSVSIKGAEGNAATLRQFPPNLQLKSLRLECLRLQLQPVGGPGVLGPALKQLQLFSCKLFGDDEKLAGVLSHLPGLEHLTIMCTYQNNKGKTTGVRCPTSMFQQMPQLTHLMLFGAELLAPDDNSPVPQQQVLTRLVDLQLASTGHERSPSVTASMLSGASQMTRLGLTRCSFEVGALAGKSDLLHLDLQSFSIFDAMTDQ